jgi:hypothetical protein
MKKLILIGILVLGMTPVSWGGPANAPKAKAYYQGALKAYLDGDYDKAVLMDSLALQLDPQLDKAANLLNVLTIEMDKAHQTDIWIGSPGSSGQVTPLVPATSLVGKRIIPSKPADVTKLTQLQAQIQVMEFLMSRNSEEQVKIFQMTRKAPKEKPDLKIPSSPQVLFLLALLLAIIALVASMKTRQELKRYKDYFLSHNTPAADLEKILLMRRFGR